MLPPRSRASVTFPRDEDGLAGTAAPSQRSRARPRASTRTRPGWHARRAVPLRPGEHAYAAQSGSGFGFTPRVETPPSQNQRGGQTRLETQNVLQGGVAGDRGRTGAQRAARGVPSCAAAEQQQREPGAVAPPGVQGSLSSPRAAFFRCGSRVGCSAPALSRCIS